MLGAVTSLATASVRAGLFVGRTIVQTAPRVASAVVGRVLPFGGSEPPPSDADRYAVRVDVPAPEPAAPREPPAEPASAAEPSESPERAAGPDVEAAAAEVVDPHIEADGVELVAEVADPGAAEGPGPEVEFTDRRDD